MLCIDCGIGFEIIKSTACSPCPRAKGAPVFRLALLSLIDETDNSSGYAGSIVRLHAGRIKEDKSPSGCDQLPGVGQAAVCIQLWKLERRGFDRLPRGMLFEDLFSDGSCWISRDFMPY